MTALVLSLFPGIGLLDRAFEEEGFCIVRGPDVLWGGDVRNFHPPAHRFDGVIGGPPCQSFSSLVHLVRAKGNEPRFGNLIPEFTRCVVTAAPHWFLMENVPAAPTPELGHAYSVSSFLIDNADLDAGDGLGEEQMRTRRFVFGVRHPYLAMDLRRFIAFTALRLPKASGAVTQETVNNSPEARGRVLKSAVIGHGGSTPQQRLPQRLRRHTVVGGGGAHRRHSLDEAIRLQGLPPDFFEHSPFTKDAKRDVVAAGVPLPMGRALARAVKQALDLTTNPETSA